jgi:tRNA dimethylallyltransferase
VRALLEGWTIPPRNAAPALRAELEAWAEREGRGALHERLRQADPEAAARIDPRNLRRVMRALEVTLATGRPFSAQRTKTPPAYRTLIVGLALPRARLYERIDARVEWMLANGLVEETRALLAHGYDESLPALSAIGYRQVALALKGEIDMAEAGRRIKHDTRRFVRQQSNWFRKDDPQIRWHDAEGLDVEALAREIADYFADPRPRGASSEA